MDTPPPSSNPRKIPFTLVSVLSIFVISIFGIIAYTRVADTNIFPTNKAFKQPEVITTYFPSLNIGEVRPDPTNNHFFWVLAYSSLMQINTETQDIVDFAQKIRETGFSDVVQLGDRLFLGHQGVLEYNLRTGAKKQYSENNGLASNDNIRMTVDPSDSDTLWISTFAGLNKLTISSGHIETFRSEMGIPSTDPQGGLQPKVIGIDNNYLWVTVNTNVSTTGGVARLDKKTGIWKSWGYTSFASAAQKSRFDTFAAAADGERAILEETGAIGTLYNYNSVQDVWQPIKVPQKDPAGVKYLSLKGNHVYYLSYDDTPIDLNIATGVAHSLSTIDLSFGQHAMWFDQQQNRMIFYPTDTWKRDPRNAIKILSLDGSNSLTSFPFVAFEKKFRLINVALMDAQVNRILLKDADRLLEYDVPKSSIRTLLPYNVQIAQFLDDKIVALNLEQCGMGGCGPTTTATVLSVNSGSIDFDTEFSKIEVPYSYIDKASHGVYLYESSGERGLIDFHPTNIYKLSMLTKSFEDVSTTSAQNLFPILKPYITYSQSPDGLYYVAFKFPQIGDTATFTLQKDSTPSVRSTPSISGLLVGTQPVGAYGSVISGPVQADNLNWWNINYEKGVDGWTDENSLVQVTPTPLPIPTFLSIDGSETLTSTPTPTPLPSKKFVINDNVRTISEAVDTLELPVASTTAIDFFTHELDKKIEVRSYSFDPIHSGIVWIGTNRGLIRLDITTHEHRLYTTDDGLPDNDILSAISTGTFVAVQHSNGVYVYNFQ